MLIDQEEINKYLKFRGDKSDKPDKPLWKVTKKELYSLLFENLFSIDTIKAGDIFSRGVGNEMVHWYDTHYVSKLGSGDIYIVEKINPKTLVVRSLYNGERGRLEKIDQEKQEMIKVNKVPLWNFFYPMGTIHLDFIKQALDEGKPVPKEVIESYPEELILKPLLNKIMEGNVWKVMKKEFLKNQSKLPEAERIILPAVKIFNEYSQKILIPEEIEKITKPMFSGDKKGQERLEAKQQFKKTLQRLLQYPYDYSDPDIEDPYAYTLYNEAIKALEKLANTIPDRNAQQLMELKKLIKDLYNEWEKLWRFGSHFISMEYGFLEVDPHRLAVKTAISEKLDIPREVYKDYPKLERDHIYTELWRKYEILEKRERKDKASKKDLELMERINTIENERYELEEKVGHPSKEQKERLKEVLEIEKELYWEEVYYVK